MKKLLSILLASTFIMLSACSSNTAAAPLTAAISNLPSSLSIYCPDALYNEYYKKDAEAQTAWQDYMLDTYGINIIINAGAPQIECYNGYNILKFIKDGSIAPLDEYLADNKVWNSLPESFRNKFLYEGHIWAIPRSTQTTLTVSSIRTDWLDTVKKDMPTNTSTLAEVGQAFAADDANGDRNKNDYLIGENYGICSDILASFGLYTTKYNSTYGYIARYSPVTYDPTLDCIVDCMYKPEAKEALQYLRDLYNDGQIDMDALWGSNQANCLKGDYGLVQTAIGDATYDISKEYEALPPLSEENPLIYSENNEGFTINKKTANPKETINAFVDLMFSSVKNYLEWSVGIPGNYTVNSDKSISLQYTDEIMKQVKTKPNFINCPEIILGNAYTFVLPEQTVGSAKKIYAAKEKYVQKYIEKYTESGQLYKVPVWYSSIYNPDSFSSREYLLYYSSDAFMEAMESVMKPEISVDEIIQTYKSETLGNKQYAEYLKQTNETIGKELAIKIE